MILDGVKLINNNLSGGVKTSEYIEYDSFIERYPKILLRRILDEVLAAHLLYSLLNANLINGITKISKIYTSCSE